MGISIYGYDKNKQFFSLNPEEMRIRRLSKKLDHFFRFTYQTGKYAQSTTSKGTFYPVLVTLTYPSNKEWDKRDITKVVDGYRKHWKQSMGQCAAHFRYCWVAELQKRGVIHYHLVLWCKRGHSMPKPDTYFKKGHTKIEGIRKGVWNYLKKYLSKGSKDTKGGFPKGARIFGSGGLPRGERAIIAYDALPNYIKTIFKRCDGTVRRVKGGFEQGKLFVKSQWSVYRGELNDERIICMEWAYSWVALVEKDDYLERMENKNA
jgi:hypothetical protein